MKADGKFVKTFTKEMSTERTKRWYGSNMGKTQKNTDQRGSK
jgi:hypothetical protein